MSGVSSTTQEIRENPSKMAVTSPMSGKEMEEDIQRKMKLWGVIQAFGQGRLPTNRQMDSALEYAVEHSPVEVDKLSQEGKVLIDDTRDIIETLRTMVQEKNADELFQNAVWNSYAGDPSRAKQDGVVPVSKEDAKKDVDQAAAHLRVLITLFITNSEFRKLASDFGIIGRDVFATAASKVADTARPDQEQLDQVDQEAPSKQWVGPDGKKLGTQDTPELQLKNPAGDGEVRYNPKDAPSDAKITGPDGQQMSAGEAYQKAQDAKEQAKSQAQDAANQASANKDSLLDQAKSHASDVASQRDPNASLSTQKEQLKNAASNKADQASNQADANTPDRDEVEGQARNKMQQLKEKIPEEHRQKVRDTIDTTKDILTDAMPEERREQFIYRLKKVVVECQEHKDYMEAMTWLLDTLENYQGHAQHVANKGADAADGLKTDAGIATATSQFRTLLERFANGKSMSGMTDALDQIYTDAKEDDSLRGWFTKLNDFTHRALLEPGWILDDECNREASQLQESGKEFFTEKYKGHQEKLFNEIQAWFTALAEDPLNQRLGDDVKRLTKDLLFNSEGNLTFKPKLWNDIRHTILPTLIKQIGYVPIPRAEYSDDKIDLVIENLVLSGPNLFPNVVELEAHNRFKFSPYSNINKTLDVHHHRFRAGLSQIQADIRDVSFAFKRKSGWPRLSDHGLADVVIAGRGISIDIEVESVENRRDSVFKVNHVNVELDTLKFSIRDSKHDLLYKFIKGIATGVIKKAITVAVQSAIKSALEHADDQLVEVRNTMERAKRSDETTRTQALKDLYARKKQHAQDAAERADQKTGTFKIVTDRDDMINPNMTHDPKKSSAQRMFKVEDMAASGDEWRSPAFDLLDKKHPAVTGENHPEATPGMGHKDVQSSAVAAARGEQVGVPKDGASSVAGSTTAAGSMDLGPRVN
ncbi:hypothetical protein BD324DRAFT_578011 [Kockovaella imperatae]|uniref:Uncharacterized protein n=1 Tax=Kockovaella imperatae TaxID=4999 RepID=A0A1Y1UKH3_9TREE|nr:hypothetical protein BD324DRAFT_578011 [Kockovaella imperatae]ORX38560.1 hypothetical protein BD324DRAFT_578011 [Kockovaella imperatae]